MVSRHAPNKSLGNLLSWTKEKFGLSGETDLGKFNVTFMLPSLVRITIIPSPDDFDSFSYSVIAQPLPSPFTIKEDEETLAIKTKSLIVNIKKNPVRFSFTDLKNNVLNEDDPAFGTTWNGTQVTTYKKIQEGERFIGLGEKTGNLDRRGTGYQNWNTDSFAYTEISDPLYCTIPFYIGIHHQQVYGLFFDNSFKTFFNFGASNNRFSSFSADAGPMDYYFIHGKNIPEIIRHYTHLTGRISLPPRWSLGYQQCRYSYYPDKEVLRIAQTFRDKDIPADTLVLDIHYMEAFKIFTWGKHHFPNPKKLIRELKNLNFHVVVICDPGIKVEKGYEPFDDGIKKNVFLRYPDGSIYEGQVWPGWCHFPDFSNPETRVWWGEKFKEYVQLGIEGFWNDMNEPATWGNMLPENIEMDFEGRKGSIREGKNVYGSLMAASTHEGVQQWMKDKRVFNLTRSGYAGIQRHAAVWTGDNVAYDEHMMLGVRLTNSLGLSGVAFCGYDVGGFVGDAGSDLFARWISLGAFSPFFRGHSKINSKSAEPWAFGEETEHIAKNYIKFRYRLMPYIYSLFYEATQLGMPVQRSLAIDYPFDDPIYNEAYQHQYLFGPFLMVAPVESIKSLTKVYLPEGDWYSLYDGRAYKGISETTVDCPTHQLPVFVKGGGMLILQDSQPFVANPTELQIHLYKGSKDTHFTYYEDDGESFEYRKGNFQLKRLTYQSKKNQLVIGESEGGFTPLYKMLTVIFHGFGKISQAQFNSNKIQVSSQKNWFFEGLEKYDPLKDPKPTPEEAVQAVKIPYSFKAITLTWK